FLSALAAAPAAAETVKIGFITTLSGPQGAIGEHMKSSVELALDHLGRKIGGLDVEIVYGDDQVKPDVGKQLADEMLKKHRVHFVAGVIWSNVMLAVAPTVTGAGTFMIGTNAGPHELAGKMCHELFFTTSWQNDQTPEAMGKYMQDQNITDVYAMAPNYAAGKDMIAGVKRYFKNKIVGEVYTQLGQQDYQAEISQLRAASPKAVFVFYPGGMGIQFLKQYAQAGLRGQIPLYSVYTVDEISLPAVKEAALGQFETRYWSPDLKNDANQKHVADFRKKYGKRPVFYGAQSYDGLLLIDSPIRAEKGEQTLNGLQYGVMLFLMAAGLTLVFGIMNLVNLAHGSLYMVGAYLAAAFAQWSGSFVLGVALALPATLLVGIAVEVTALRTLYE